MEETVCTLMKYGDCPRMLWEMQGVLQTAACMEGIHHKSDSMPSHGHRVPVADTVMVSMHGI